MKRYIISHIEWDEEPSEIIDNVLPLFKFIDTNKSLEELRNGAAADILSDEYGFCVKSLTVEEAANRKMFTVFIRRLETYYLPVNVLAKDENEARDKVRHMDSYEGGDKFLDSWNELQPDVNTTYEAEPADEPERGEGPAV